MTMISLGDLARNLMLQRQTSATHNRLSRLTQEIATGRHADQAAASRGNLGPLLGIEAALARIGGWQTATRTLETRLDTMQAALGALDGIGGAVATTLLSAGSATQDDQVDLAAQEARSHLDAAIGILNARSGEYSVFAGARSDHPAVISPDALLDLVLPLAASQTTAAGVQAAIAAWFDDPAGFDSQAYTGGAALAEIWVGPEQKAGLPVTATDPALKSLLAGLVAAAVMDRGILSDDPVQRRELAGRAGETLSSNAAPRTALAARIGTVQARLTQAQARNAAEDSVLGIARSGLVSVDPYATASDIEATRTQLETLYTLTARLSGLSLIEMFR